MSLRMQLRAAGLGLVALATMGQSLPPPPQVLFGPLFEAVQAARIYPDSKTFADATPREAPDAVMAAWRAERPQGADALRAFVERHFVVPAQPGAKPSLREHIAALWPQLTRPAFTPPPGSSALAMPEPYVVPGGRFREIYYWDSYFTMLGLKADGQDRLITGMLDDFDSLVARYGFVPNGTRTYYLGRSQPPFLALMADLDPRHDAVTAARHLAALKAEHAFWMKGADAARRTGAAARVVRMPDGSLLNRYWDDAPGPRDESWAEDVATARTSGRPVAEVYKDLRAGAESGWDYSSRWLADPARLDTIRTTQIVPVDLNSLLWAQEQAIARRCGAAGDKACAADFAAQAAARAAPSSAGCGCRAKAALPIGTASGGHPPRAFRPPRSIPCLSAWRRRRRQARWPGWCPSNSSRPADCAPRPCAPGSSGTIPTAGRRCNGSRTRAWRVMARPILPPRLPGAGWRRWRRPMTRPARCWRNTTSRLMRPVAAGSIRCRTALAGPTG
jgi:hypothetical protein